MKTIAKTLTSYGNCTLVQLEVSHGSEFAFRPGGPEITSGGLIISEAGGNGIVGKLIAVNNTDSFLLLTDADVLAGAKQNRVLNRSVLFHPFSKTMIDVSCIEKRRWHYTTATFSSPSEVADHDLRKTKAESASRKNNHPEKGPGTQQTVWSHISNKMKEVRFESDTENYSDLVSFKQGRQRPVFPDCEPEKGCNALAVLINGKTACIDIFGNEEVYRHYFPKLRDSAFLQATAGHGEKAMDFHEAFYKVTELLDHFDRTEKTQDRDYSAAGSLFTRDETGFFGIGLEFESHLVHCSLFGK